MSRNAFDEIARAEAARDERLDEIREQMRQRRLCRNGLPGEPPPRTLDEVYRDRAERYRNLAKCAPNHDEARDCLRLADTAESLARSVERGHG